MGPLATSDGRSARCTVHGGEFRILFQRAAMEESRADGVAVPPAVPFSPPEGMKCVQHPGVLATRQCQSCGGYMCETCDFALAGGLHLCPSCATRPQTGLSPKRKRALVVSLVLAVWCTVVMGAMMAGAFARFVQTESEQEAFGTLLMLILLVPSIVGLAQGLGSIDRRLQNPPILWVATVWNGLVLGGFLLLCIIGLAA